MKLYNMPLSEAYKVNNTPVLELMSAPSEGSRAFISDDKIDDFRKLMNNSNYALGRESVMTFLCGYMLGMKKPNGEPRYTMDEVLNPETLGEEKKAIVASLFEKFEKAEAEKAAAQNANPNAEQNPAQNAEPKVNPNATSYAELLEETDTAVVAGFKRISSSFMNEYETIVRNNDTAALMNTRFMMLPAMVADAMTNIYAVPAFADRIRAIESKQLIVGEQGVQEKSFEEYSDKVTAAATFAMYTRQQVEASKRAFDFHGINPGDYILTYLNTMVEMKRMNTKLHDGTMQSLYDYTLEDFSNFQDRGYSREMLTDEEVDEDTSTFVENTLNQAKDILKNPMMAYGLFVKISKGEIFANPEQLTKVEDGQVVEYAHDITFPSKRELLAEAVKSDYTVNLDITPLNQEYYNDLHTRLNRANGAPTLEGRTLTEEYAPYLAEANAVLERLKDMNSKPVRMEVELKERLDLLNQVSASIDKIDTRWVRNFPNASVGAINNILTTIKTGVSEIEAAYYVSQGGGRFPARVPTENDNAVTSDSAVEMRNMNFDKMYEDLTKAGSYFKSSVEWKRMMAAMRMVKTYSVKNSTNATLVLLDEALNQLQKSTQEYLEHKLSNDKDAADVDRIMLAKKVLGCVKDEKALTENRIAELAKDQAVIITDPMSVTAFQSRGNLFAEFKRLLSSSRRFGDRSSDAFDEMVKAINELGKECTSLAKDAREKYAKGEELDPIFKDHYADKVKAAMEKLNQYLAHKQLENDGTDRSLKRIVLANTAARYIRGMVQELPKIGVEISPEQIQALIYPQANAPENVQVNAPENVQVNAPENVQVNELVVEVIPAPLNQDPNGDVINVEAMNAILRNEEEHVQEQAQNNVEQQNVEVQNNAVEQNVPVQGEPADQVQANNQVQGEQVQGEQAQDAQVQGEPAQDAQVQGEPAQVEDPQVNIQQQGAQEQNKNVDPQIVQPQEVRQSDLKGAENAISKEERLNTIHQNIKKMEDANRTARNFVEDKIQEMRNNNSQEEVKAIAKSQQVTDALRVMYVYEWFKAQQKIESQKPENRGKSMDEILLGKLPMVASCVVNGTVASLFDKIKNSQNSFERKVVPKLCLRNLNHLINDDYMKLFVESDVKNHEADPQFNVPKAPAVQQPQQQEQLNQQQPQQEQPQPQQQLPHA